MKYEIYGDYATTNETLLEQFDSLDEAAAWADCYVRDGDFGGYGRIEVIEFAPDGEAITHYNLEYADDWDDGQPSTYEEYQDLWGGDDRFESSYNDY